MKKLIAILMALAILCTAFASCAGLGSYDDLMILDLGLERE